MVWTNLSFETAGVTPGSADGWTTSDDAQVWQLAQYAVSVIPLYYYWEPFDYLWSGNEGWHYAFIPADLDVSEYDVALEEFEDFEEEWNSNEDDQTSFLVTDLDAATYYAGLGLDVETFGNPITGAPPDPANWIGTDWAGQDWKSTFNDAVDLSSASYDVGVPQDFEDFEEEWSSNENDELVAFDPGDLSVATFHAGYPTTQNYENFESVFVERDFVVDPVTDVLTLGEPHTLPADAPLHVRTPAGVLPDPLNSTFIYYVKVSTPPNDITISESAGGAVLDILDEGVGEHLIVADSLWYWTISLD